MNKKTTFHFLKILLGIFVCFSVIFLPSVVQSKTRARVSSTYRNPVFEPVLADPSVIRAQDGYWYAYGTEDDWGDGHGPHLISILRSRNLTKWELVGDAFKDRPLWKEEGNIWAPHIAFYREKFYLYYSISVWGDVNPGIGVALSDNPCGPFVDQGVLFTSRDIGVANSIDPMFFLDDDDKPYLIWGSFNGIFGIKLRADGLKTGGEEFQIAGCAFEAPFIIKRNGYYYFFGSSGTCCEGENSGYYVSVGRSKLLQGPYLGKDGKDLLYSGGVLLLTGHFPNTNVPVEFAGPGHNCVIRDDRGKDWIIYHAVDKLNPVLPNGATRRPLMMDPLIWKNGWPMVKDLVPSTGRQKGPYLK